MLSVKIQIPFHVHYSHPSSNPCGSLPGVVDLSLLTNLVRLLFQVSDRQEVLGLTQEHQCLGEPIQLQKLTLTLKTEARGEGGAYLLCLTPGKYGSPVGTKDLTRAI